jgi:hypothetical protein
MICKTFSYQQSMLLIKDLYKPCFASWSCDQTIRFTWTWPSSTVTVTSENCVSWPFFPFTVITVLNLQLLPGITMCFYLFWHLIVYLLVYVTNYFTTIFNWPSSSHQTRWKTIAIPNPLRILGMVELELRKPGLLIFDILLLTLCISLSYLKHLDWTLNSMFFKFVTQDITLIK